MQLIIILVALNIILFFRLNKLSSIINIYDKPDKERKFHKKIASVTGGSIFFINYLIFIFLINIIDVQTIIIQTKTIPDIFTWIIFPSVVFIIGLYDDKKNLKGLTKFLLILIIALSLVLIDPSLLIKKIKFNFLYFEFNLNSFSIPFTIFCIICFLNAFNMFDGVDLQVGGYIIFIILVLFFKIGILNDLISIFFGSILFFYVNAKKNIFLGDGGTYFVGLIISLILIKSYNLGFNIFCDEILVIMLLPGLEMARLFVERIVKKKNPLLGDRNHLHHLLINYFKNQNHNFIILISSIIYYTFIIFYFNFQRYEIIICYILIYFIFINYLKKKID